MNNALHDSLLELYIDGGLELFLAGTRGLKRELIIKLETSALTPEKGEIIHSLNVAVQRMRFWWNF
jgi:hypothetical protein